MFDSNKTDRILGHRVHEHLVSLGIETPTTDNLAADASSRNARVESITTLLRAAMAELGLDLNDDSLKDSPRRVAKMWVNELMWGLSPDNFPKLMAIENKMRYNEMVLERNIKVMSLCEHHFVTIDGKCHVAYIPNGNVAGLSKLNRVVEYFSRRPQVQERLTAQIMETLKFVLGTEDVAVVIEADHYCVISRGVEDQNSDTISSALSGKFLEPAVRAEFFSLIKR